MTSTACAWHVCCFAPRVAQVRLEQIRKRYPGARRDTLPGLDLTLPDGELTVLVGPSGCGKSTTLRLIAGLEEPSAGDVFIGERNVTAVAPADRDIAMVFQSYALYPHMTVYDNLAFALRMRKTPRAAIDSRVRDAARALGIDALLQRLPRELSGGQRQRVAIGRAVVRDPQVFLFDEPLSNLDAQLRVEMRREIARIHKRAGTTCVYVTHDQTEAMTLADRIVVMHEGIVQQVGSPLSLYESPANLFVASFLGSPAMNFIEATIDTSDSGAWASMRGLRAPLDETHQRLTPGRDVVVGVRPQDLSLRPGEFGTEALPACVEVREVTGSEAFVHLRSEAGPLVVRTPAGEAASEGQNVSVFMNPRKLHFFDAETAERL